MRKLRVFASISITAVAKGMNAATRYVASMTTQPIWSNTHLLKRDLVTAVRELKASEGDWRYRARQRQRGDIVVTCAT